MWLSRASVHSHSSLSRVCIFCRPTPLCFTLLSVCFFRFAPPPPPAPAPLAPFTAKVDAGKSVCELSFCCLRSALSTDSNDMCVPFSRDTYSLHMTNTPTTIDTKKCSMKTVRSGERGVLIIRVTVLWAKRTEKIPFAPALPAWLAFLATRTQPIRRKCTVREHRRNRREQEGTSLAARYTQTPLTPLKKMFHVASVASLFIRIRCRSRLVHSMECTRRCGGYVPALVCWWACVHSLEYCVLSLSV